LRALGENKSKVRIFTGNGHAKSAEILKGILRHIKIQIFKKCGLGGGGERSESDQASIRWRNGNVVHAFIVASVLSGLDVVRIEVELQKVLQGLRIAKKNTGTCVDLGLGGSAGAGRVDVCTLDSRRYGGETDLVCDKNNLRTESSPDHCDWSCCGVGGNDKMHTAKNEGQ
jgi:hypothetical protein